MTDADTDVRLIPLKCSNQHTLKPKRQLVLAVVVVMIMLPPEGVNQSWATSEQSINWIGHNNQQPITWLRICPIKVFIATHTTSLRVKVGRDTAAAAAAAVSILSEQETSFK